MWKKCIFLIMSLASLSALADPWDHAPCSGVKCKVYVASLSKLQDTAVVGPAYFSYNGKFHFDLFMYGQTSGTTLNEPIFDLDLELYKWMKIDRDEEHSHFHLVARSSTPGNEGESLEYGGSEGLYQIRVRKISGKSGNVAVFLKSYDQADYEVLEESAD